MDANEKKRLIGKRVSAEKRAAIAVANGIAEFAELGFEEHRSSKLLSDYLARRGFEVSYPWPHMPTAFKAICGSGAPSIGLLAEYDALPDCGPRDGINGHGCGHNLLGTAAAVGAVAAAGMLADSGHPGSVVLWGCPAEEMLAGKAYMARDGAFRENDAILGWHPGSGNSIGRCGGSAVDSLLFEFFGKTAHGASAHAGRSALDGVMLLDVAANYLREHVPENVRIHMCIQHGGSAPNVVPAYASAWYYVRARDRDQVDAVRERLIKCARGAAMATETKVKIKRLTGTYNRLQNTAMGDVVEANFKLFGAPKATARDAAQVEKIGLKADFAASLSTAPGTQGRASSDEDNVSWLAPFGRFSVACISRGVNGHHRDYAAQVTLPFAHRGMLRAAEIFAGAAYDLCTDAGLLARVREEFETATKDFEYDPLLPARQRPWSMSS